MAKAFAQSRQVSGRILLHLTPTRSSLEISLEPSYWPLKWEANPPNSSWVRLFSMQAKPQAQVRKTGALQVSMSSPGFVYEPYSPRQPISFWSRLRNVIGCSSPVSAIAILESIAVISMNRKHFMYIVDWEHFGKHCSYFHESQAFHLKSAYAISKLRKSGYSKQKFYKEAVDLYKEINTQMANGDKVLLRKSVTENMYSALKNEIKHRETLWNYVYWELVMPLQKIRTLRARLIGVDRSDLSKVFVQLTLEFLSKQKFEAYDFSGAVIAGDKDKEVLVRDIWVFEKSLFHQGAYWRLCGRIKL